ncbi:hypothetical protein GUJ93_ZPchr0217g6461, partial [Zizania palustris]
MDLSTDDASALQSSSRPPSPGPCAPPAPSPWPDLRQLRDAGTVSGRCFEGACDTRRLPPTQIDHPTENSSTATGCDKL